MLTDIVAIVKRNNPRNFYYKNIKVYIIVVELIFSKQEKLLICRQFDMLYNLG
jgi:hypothetical protein